ncbi:MAG: lamin tail domain-containing protein [Chloroflexaceae bacterium]|jgi:hypothetical protein|nr:lamin tail domain-containing protein [Chloroflexaceae bacterium]
MKLIPLCIALGFVLLGLSMALAQTPACQTQRCVYLPLVLANPEGPGGTPTATATTTATAVPVTPTITPTASATPTATPIVPPRLEFVDGSADSLVTNLPDGFVNVQNQGLLAVTLTGWTITIEDKPNDPVYTFPAFTLGSNRATVTVYTGSGTNDEGSLYWGRTTATWLSSDVLVLRDAQGTIISTWEMEE